MRRALYHQLDPYAREEPGLSVLNASVVGLITVALVITVLATERAIWERWASTLLLIELIVGAVFLVEYLLRVWVAPEAEPDANPWLARWRYVRSPAALLDLIALSPVLLAISGSESWLLRLVRLALLLRLARIGRLGDAWDEWAEALRERVDDLFLSVGLTFSLMLVAASALYMVEGAHQPEAFGSILRSMWWAVITLTTVGYGDAVPVTGLGRLFAALTGLAGIGLLALPTGIVAASFSDAMQRRRMLRLKLGTNGPRAEAVVGRRPSVSADHEDLRSPLIEAYFQRRSAHSDVAIALVDALAGLEHVETRFDSEQASAVRAIAARTVFAAAAEMSEVYFRLAPVDLRIALATGGERCEVGADWVRFILFRPAWPQPDLKHFARQAWIYARTHPY